MSGLTLSLMYLEIKVSTYYCFNHTIRKENFQVLPGFFPFYCFLHFILFLRLTLLPPSAISPFRFRVVSLP